MDIIIRNLQTRIPIRLPAVKQIVQQTLKYLGQTQGEVSIVFVSPVRMRKLNALHLKHHYSTDILTFDYRMSAQSNLYAEIIICPSVAKQNAKIYGKTVMDELTLYLVHGFLHLMGFDDHAPKDVVLMRKKEMELMKYLTSHQ